QHRMESVLGCNVLVTILIAASAIIPLMRFAHLRARYSEEMRHGWLSHFTKRPVGRSYSSGCDVRRGLIWFLDRQRPCGARGWSTSEIGPIGVRPTAAVLHCERRTNKSRSTFSSARQRRNVIL